MAPKVRTGGSAAPEYSLKLYRALHPEDQKTTEDGIRIVTLENVLLNQPYNDLGMIISGLEEGDDLETSAEALTGPGREDRLLIMCEAQSTWSLNILVRMLICWAQTLQEYIVETRQNLYGSRKVRFPAPEFYVLYTVLKVPSSRAA